MSGDFTHGKKEETVCPKKPAADDVDTAKSGAVQMQKIALKAATEAASAAAEAAVQAVMRL